MDLNMKPEPTRRLKALYEIPTPSGYEPPILGAINQMVNNIQEQRDNAIMVQIREQIGVNVDKNELIRALNYDRNQFNEGYRKGYRDALEKHEEADRWISVSEKLPEEYGNFLVFTSEGDIDVGTYNPSFEDSWSMCDANGFFWVKHRDIEVIAWQPLPKPYESEAEE